MSLKARTTKALFWVGISTFLNRFLSFATTLVLARLLTPNDFGLIALATTVINPLQLLSDLGLTRAIVARKDKVDAAANAALPLVLASGVAISGLIYLVAPLVGAFFQKPQATPLLQALSITVFLSSSAGVPNALLEKELRFKRKFFPGLAALLTYAGVAVLLALRGAGVWSIVWGQVISSLVESCVSWGVCRWRPSLTFDRAIAREVLGFGRCVIESNFLVLLWLNMDNVFVGKLSGTEALGFYALAFSLANMPMQFTTNLINSVALPMYVKLQHDRAALTRVFLQSLRMTTVVSLPISLGMFALASYIIPTFYGEKWRQSITLLQILSFYGLTRTIAALTGNILLAIGKESVPPKVQRVQIPLAIILLFPVTSHFGAVGTSLVMTGVLAGTTIVFFKLLSGYLGIPWKALAKALAPQSACALLMILVVELASRSFPQSAVSMAYLTLIGAATYAIAILVATKGATYKEGLALLYSITR